MKRAELKKWCILILASMLVLSLFGCSRQAPSEGQAPAQQGAQPSSSGAEKVVKIGASIPLSGSLSNEGMLYYNGYNLWKDYVNQQGGIKVGNERYKVELILYDDQSDAQTAAKLTEKLITEDKVNFLLATASSGLVQATSSIAERYRTIMLAPIANAEPLYTRGYKYLFGLTPRAAENVSSILDMAYEYKLPIKTVSIVTPDSMFPVATAEGIRQKAEKYGMTVVDFIKHPPTNTELSTIASQIKAHNPDAVFYTGNYQAVLMFLRALKEQGVNPKLIGMQDAPGMPEFVPNLGRDAEGLTGTAWWWENVSYQDPVFGSAQKFAELYRQKYGLHGPVPYRAAAAAGGAEVLQMAIEKAGTLDTEKVREALLNTKFETMFMPVQFSDQGELKQINIAGKPVVLQIQGGKPVVVYPSALKQAEVIFPLKPWGQR